ncbi:MAG: glycosyltransferase [Crocinitomicaceae bacterium]|nr:glycosyltransferase [Crocinitomicaceae bacterium]
MEKRFAVLLSGPIDNDYRVIKTITSLSTIGKVDLYCLADHYQIFATHKQVTVYLFQQPNTLFSKFLRHSFFCFEFSFLAKTVLNKGKHYDVIWANDLPTLYPASKIAQTLGAKLIYDAHEIYCETLNQFFPQKSTFFKKTIFQGLITIMRLHGSFFEKKQTRKADLFITVNDSISNYFKELYDLSQHPTVIMNYPSQINTEITPYPFRDKFNWAASDLIFLYQGILNAGRGLPVLIELFSKLSKRYKLVILGNGGLEKQLKKAAAQKQATNIVFFDLVPLNELPSYTAGADVGFNLLEPLNLSKQMASPNKLFEYIQAGIAVIGSDTIENKKVISATNIGLVSATSVTQLEATIDLLTSEKLNEFKRNCRKISSDYSWENQEETLITTIQNIINGKTT